MVNAQKSQLGQVSIEVPRGKTDKEDRFNLSNRAITQEEIVNTVRRAMRSQVVSTIPSIREPQGDGASTTNDPTIEGRSGSPTTMR